MKFSLHTSRRLLGCTILCALLSCFNVSAQFHHRAYLGWIRDLASEAKPTDEWPCITIDSNLLHDYDQTFKVMRETGLNEIVIWGFFVSREWPVALENTMDDTRKEQVMAIINKAHAYNIKVLSGLGVYNWGFDAIIRANPHLSCKDNPHSMCLYQPESWEWQKRVIDYIFSLPLDGVNLQSADQGRCSCDESRNMSDMAYHAVINQKVIQYIRKEYPGKIISIGGWGMNIKNKEDLLSLHSMTNNADYFTDVRDNNLSPYSDSFRVNMINKIKPCLYGTTGTPNVEPPQHWVRDRWFLPTAKRAAKELQRLYRQGGRSVENYMHVIANPGDEATIRLMAAIEQNPGDNWAPAYKLILSKMFSPVDKEAMNELFELFINAEDNYFNNIENYKATDIVRLEPLVSDKAGKPVYILEKMKKENRRKYLAGTERLLQKAESLKTKVGNKPLMEKVITCLNNTRQEILHNISTIPISTPPAVLK
ncbi:MAG: hypothetical protein ABI760_24735 [Ferruginibacter sp.]